MDICGGALFCLLHAPSKCLLHDLIRESSNSCCLGTGPRLALFGMPQYEKTPASQGWHGIFVSAVGTYFLMTTDLVLAWCPNMPSTCHALRESGVVPLQPECSPVPTPQNPELHGTGLVVVGLGPPAIGSGLRR